MRRLRAFRRAPSLVYQLLVDGRYDFTYDQMPISVRGMPWVKRVNLIRSGLNLLHGNEIPNPVKHSSDVATSDPLDI